MLAVTAIWLYFQNRDPHGNLLQAYLPPPENTSYLFTGDTAGFPALSPEGGRLAFVATDERGGRLIWIRSLTDGSVRSLPGTDSASFPFWSFDGKSVGYFAGGKLKRISVAGGSPVDIADADNPRGGTWNQDDVILFAPSSQTPIYRVSAAGGTPKPITAVDQSRHTTHRWPFFLPDGKRFLYLAASHAKPHADLDAIYVASLDGKENRLLTISTSNAIAVPGYLLFLQDRTLMAQPFEISGATLRGEPFAIAQNVHFEEGNWHAVFDCASNGTLIYQRAVGLQGSQLLWYNRDGHVVEKLGDTDRYRTVRLSPDGRRLAVLIGEPGGSIWVYDLARGTRTRYTFGGAWRQNPSLVTRWQPNRLFAFCGGSIRHLRGCLQRGRNREAAVCRREVEAAHRLVARWEISFVHPDSRGIRRLAVTTFGRGEAPALPSSPAHHQRVPVLSRRPLGRLHLARIGTNRDLRNAIPWT